MQIITKAEFARRLGVTRGRISQYSRMGMPTRVDGRLDLDVALVWVRSNIAPPWPTGGRDVALTQADIDRVLDG